nr:hypothetical protein GCM10020185_81270 [Pseudomonas brassicacearum subsp. brassicacearum]
MVDEWRHNSSRQIALQLPAQTHVYSTVDPDAFGILLRNLIENALKYGAMDQPIEVTLTDQALLRVINAGPVVPVAVLQNLTERFVRGQSETSGSGLGLAIVKTIVQGINGRIELLSPAKRPAGGVRGAGPATACHCCHRPFVSQLTCAFLTSNRP